MKKPHRRGSYHVQARKVRDAANANPATRCWRCGLTLHQHKPHKNGRRPHWQAGHVTTGQAGGPLLPEASTCNASHGATYGNRRRRQPDPNW